MAKANWLLHGQRMVIRYQATFAIALLLAAWGWLVADSDRLRLGWTILTCAGSLFAVWNLASVISDYRTLDGNDPEVLDIQARANIITQLLIAVALGGECGAGLTSLMGISVWPLVLLIGSAIALIGLSIHQRIERQKMVSMLAADDHRHGS